MKESGVFRILIPLIVLLPDCQEILSQTPHMISVPQFEYISQSNINGATKNVNISLDAFFISNEITNKEYREFTDWVKNHPDKTFSKTKEVVINKNQEPGKTRVWKIPSLVYMSDILPILIDSNAMYRIDKKFNNYFTDEKYDDYPVTGVSRNAAEYYCQWLETLDLDSVILQKGQLSPTGTRLKENVTIVTGPKHGYYRIPLKIELEFLAKQPYKWPQVNDHKLHKATEGNPNRWGILHLDDNVSEWVIDPNDTLAIYRGDNWLGKDKLPVMLRMDPDSSKGFIGFRIARTFVPEEINKK
jgi:hypothetical protein